MDSDSLLCGILQVTSPLWALLFLIYKVKLLGQMGDRSPLFSLLSETPFFEKLLFIK